MVSAIDKSNLLDRRIEKKKYFGDFVASIEETGNSIK